MHDERVRLSSERSDTSRRQKHLKTCDYYEYSCHVCFTVGKIDSYAKHCHVSALKLVFDHVNRCTCSITNALPSTNIQLQYCNVQIRRWGVSRRYQAIRIWCDTCENVRPIKTSTRANPAKEIFHREQHSWTTCATPVAGTDESSSLIMIVRRNCKRLLVEWRRNDHIHGLNPCTWNSIGLGNFDNDPKNQKLLQ